MNVENHPESSFIPPSPRETRNERIDRGAERAKGAESAAIHKTRDAVDRGSERAERSLHHATDVAADAARRANDRAERLGEQGRAAMDRGRAYTDETLDRMFIYVRENPGKAIAMAAAGGWLLSSLLRRRRH